MRCSTCNLLSPDYAHYCYNCGSSLRLQLKPRDKLKWYILIIGILLSVTGASYYIKMHFIKPDLTVRDAKEKSATEISDTDLKPQIQTVPAKKEKNLLVGLVVLKDISGKTILKTPALVFADGWVALPKKACLGGKKWVLLLNDNRELLFEGSIFNDQDDLGLWRLSENKKINDFQLGRWDKGKTVKWVSITTAKLIKSIVIETYEHQELFLKFRLPKALNEPGILTQDDKIVGWTFGDLSEYGFLWIGNETKLLDYEMTVDDFYSMTFGFGREEQFALALDMIGKDSLENCLSAFAEGLRQYPKLSDKDTPAYLRLDAVIKQIRALIQQMREQEADEEIGYILDDQILMEAADIPLLFDVVQAIIKTDGYENAVKLAETVGDYIKNNYDGNAVLFDKLHARLYKDWLKELFDKNYFSKARRPFQLGRQAFPDDPELHLMGVQLALAEADWQKAEELFYMRRYPSALKDKAVILASRISELKGKEGKIAIHFEPGSKHIVTTAILNGILVQKFIIDTGAAKVTLPYSAIKSLGLEIDDNNPVYKVVTAGGVKYAKEIIISSIELEGWEINDVSAFVLNLPEETETGLLGLNFLNRFHMEINNEKGVLLLEPR